MPTDINLDFSAAISGTMLDRDLEGTGFTSVQVNTGDNAYKLDLINLNTSASTLALTATQGTMLLIRSRMAYRLRLMPPLSHL